MQIDALSLPELVTIAVAELGGATAFVDREDIAVKVHEIAPGRFTWRKYPDRIDLISVDSALRDAKKPKYGGFLTANRKGGWMLSPAGLEWLRKLDLDSAAVVGVERFRRDSIIPGQEQERARLMNSRAVFLFESGRKNEITTSDFYDFVRVNEYFKTKARQRRYSFIDNIVSDSEHLKAVWDYLKIQFEEEMK